MAVKFVGIDNVRDGDWIGLRGKQGRYVVAQNQDSRWTDLPGYLSVSVAAFTNISVWTDNNAYGLQNPFGGSTRATRCSYVNTAGQVGRITITATDGLPHLAAMYCLDITANRTMRAEVYDPATSTTMGGYTKTNFQNAESFWVLAAFTGSMEFRIPFQTGGGIGCTQGVFVDPYPLGTTGLGQMPGNWLS